MSVNNGFLGLCRSGVAKDVIKAIVNGADVNARDEHGNTALIFAASEKPNVKIIEAMLNNGADVNAKNNDGITALMFAAARTTYLAVITLLLQAGAEVDAALGNGWTALMFAAAANPDPEVIRVLCEGGARVNRRAEDDGTTALMLAAERNPNADVVKELIKHGANVNATDDSGRTALIGAALRNSKMVNDPEPNPEVIDALLDGGADVNAVWDGDRAIDIVRDSPYLRGTDTLTRLEVLSAQGEGDKEAVIASFLASLNVSISTRAVYGKKLRYFFSWMEKRGIHQPERKDIFFWRDELMSNGISSMSIVNYLAVVRKFFQWGYEKGLCENIAEGIEAPRLEHKFRDDTLTSGQIKRMLDSIDRSSFIGLRNYALLSLIISCGLSYAEAAGAKIEDIETTEEGSFINVDGERLDVPTIVMDALREYWKARGGLNRTNAPVFTGEKTHKNQPMSVRTIGAVVKNVAQNSGDAMVNFTPNSLKHTAVKLALQGGKRIEEVQKFARHRYIGTTYRYSPSSRKKGHTCGDTIAAALF